MKRNATWGLLLGLLFASATRATTLTGTIKYSNGRPINGVLTLQTSQRVNVLNTGTCAGPGSIVPSGPQRISIFQGSPPVGTTVVGNDCLSPAFSYYSARLVDSTGTEIFNEFWRVSGIAADIGEVLPIINPQGTPLALNGDVTGDVTQSIVQRLRGYPISNTAPVNGQILLFQGGNWAPGSVSGTGTVVNVDATVPPQFTVAGVPCSSNCTLAFAWASAIQNGVLAGPASGGPGTPTIRVLQAADIPAIPESKVVNLVTDLAGLTPTSRLVIAGAGLAGGGDLTGDVTLSVPNGGITDAMLASAATDANTPSTIVKRDSSGDFSAGTITADLAGNATNVSGTVAIVNGGTGQTTRGAAFDALSPMASTGDTIYQSSGGNARLPGNTTATKKFLTETGDGSAAAAPSWGTLAAGDVPNITESQVTGLTSDLAAKALAATTVTATFPLNGSGTLGSNLILGIAPCVGAGGSAAAGAVPTPPGSTHSPKYTLLEDCTWGPPVSAGTLSLVGLTAPPQFIVSGSPVTGSGGTLALSLGTQPANFVFGGPTTGSAAAPDFRLLVAADIPAIAESQVTGLASDLAAKADKATTVTATAPLAGSGTLGGNLTLSVGNFSTTQPGVVAASASASKFIRGDNTAQDVVTSVGVSMPGEFAVSNSPIGTTGTIAVTKANQNANLVYAGPSSGAAAAPTFRSVVPADIPALPESAITNLVSDLAALTPQSRTIATAGPLAGGGNFSGDLSLSLTLNSGGCLSASGGLGIATGCVTDAMLNPSTGFLKRDGTTQLTDRWNMGNQNVGFNILPTYGFHLRGGGMRVQFLDTPGAPSVTPQGTGGVSTWTYQIVAHDRNGGLTLVGPTGNTTFGNATLTPVNFNHVAWTAVPGATGYDVLQNGMTGSVALNIVTTTFDDVGNAPLAYTPPSRNSTADLTVDGLFQSGLFTVTGSVTALQFISTVATGTAPFIAASTTPVANFTLATDSQVPTLHTPGKVLNTATTADSANTANAIVSRDISGNFAAGTITANLTGNVTGNVSGSALNFTGPLVGDVTGTQGATVVSLVGGSTAANVHAAELLANAATAANTASTIVKRDGSGNFAAGAPTFAGQISSTLSTGTAPLVIASTTAVSNLTLAADTQLPTISTAGKVSNSATTGTASNTPSTLVLRDGSGNFAASAVTGTQYTSTIATGTAPLVVSSTTAVSNLTIAADSQLPTISTAGKVANSATTGTAANTASTLVQRDSSGNFAAANITATSFIGPAAGLITGGGAGSIDFSASAAPSAGYVPVAIDATHAHWVNATASGSVPVGRVITTTAPLLIDGGASADLSADRTLSISLTPTNPGGAIAAQLSSPGVVQAGSLSGQVNFNIDGIAIAKAFAAGPDFRSGAAAVGSNGLQVSPSTGYSWPLFGSGSTGTHVELDGNSTFPPNISMRTSHSSGGPVVTVSGDVLGQIRFSGLDSLIDFSTSTVDAAFLSHAAETFTTTAHGSSLDFYTVPAGTTTLTKHLTIDNDGKLIVPNAAVVVDATSTTMTAGIDVNGPIATRHGSVTLVNGLNSNIAIPGFSFVRSTGPTGAFSIGGFTAGVDGQRLIFYNTSSQTMTVVNEDVSSTAANRITTLTGNVIMRSTAPSLVSFIYDGTASRWLMTSFN